MCVRVRANRRMACACACALLLCALLWPDPAPAPPDGTAARHLPLSYWMHRTFNPEQYSQSGCVWMPGPTEIKHEVPLWQHVAASDASDVAPPVLVFAAHWDARLLPRVRLLVHSERELPSMRCLFWYYNAGDPVPAPAVERGVGPAGALRVVSCAPPLAPAPAPSAIAVLTAVSLVHADFTCGKPPNILTIQGMPLSGGESRSPARRRAAGVCAVWRRRGDAAARLAEWLTVLHHVGVDSVYLYVSAAHKNVMKVFDYFSWRGNITLLQVTPYTSPRAGSRQPRSSPRTPRNLLALDDNSQQQKDETFNDTFNMTQSIRSDDMIPYNDCLYRAIAKQISWIAILDLDEIIVPLRDGTWWKLGTRESRAAVQAGGELPDVLALRRFWFPALLQPRVPPAPGPAPAPAAAGGSVPPGRMFTYEWRAPTPRDHDGVTGQLLRTESIFHVGSRGVSCITAACSVWNVHSEAARVHAYTARCGGVRRAVCRTLQSTAVRDDQLRSRWNQAFNDTQNILRILSLQSHVHEDIDDE